MLGVEGVARHLGGLQLAAGGNGDVAMGAAGVSADDNLVASHRPILVPLVTRSTTQIGTSARLPSPASYDDHGDRPTDAADYEGGYEDDDDLMRGHGASMAYSEPQGPAAPIGT